MRILITGGAGFIGSALVRYLIEHTSHIIINVDSLTYAGNLNSLTSIKDSSRHFFESIDICNENSLSEVFRKYKPERIIHLAAETHVDRSIEEPGNFTQTNIVGTFNLLKVSYAYWVNELKSDSNFRFHHISTDEVFGSLGPKGLFTNATPYNPRSPYSASKASSDHLVSAWCHTYKLPTVLSICSNNYGPFQFPEKFIPHIIINAVHGNILPVYGNGLNVRDWIYIEDHVRALYQIMMRGRLGEAYLIGGNCERTNLQVVETICRILDDKLPDLKISDRCTLNRFVQDRPGHDFRYAIDATKTQEELEWRPTESFETGIRKTISWYLENQEWWQQILAGTYRLNRLGLMKQ